MADSAAPERPLSPHLQIWRFTVTMAASITHRGAGVVLYAGTLLLAFWGFALGFHGPSYSLVTTIIHSPIGFFLVAGYVWALSFHLFNGLRHLYWDAGRGLAPKMATMTAWLVYAAATLVAGFIMWRGFLGGGA